MKQQKWIVPALAGLLGVGVVFIIVKLAATPQVPQSAAFPPRGGGGAPEQFRTDGDLQRAIDALRAVVARQPDNLQAWTELGNKFFDAGRAQEAIEAYARSLTLDPKNPDVLTDQGVMYRSIGQFNKAIENFRKAMAIDPGHRVALFNLGIVLYTDLRDLKSAKETFQKYLTTGGGEHSAAVQRLIQEIEAQVPPPGGAAGQR